MNLWPPFLLTGIHLLEVSDDLRRGLVGLRRSRLRTTDVGTQCGRSPFAMTDPFWMIMVLGNLGRGYVVWDRHGRRTGVPAAVRAPRAVRLTPRPT